MDVQEQAKSRIGGWRRLWRHKVLLGTVLLVLFLPAMLAPSHPVAVYGYLAHRFFGESSAPITGDRSFAAFLIAPEQVQRYRDDLIADMLDPRSGKLFVVIRTPDGTLRQEALRTWNAFLPARLPAPICRRLDRMEIPFFGDEVGLWLEGNTILATGHYHPFGGGPSKGDLLAQRFAPLPEIVVSNGLVPGVYLEGDLIPYGSDVAVVKDIFRSLRSLEPSLTMALRLAETHNIPHQPSRQLRSVLAYFRDYEQVDITDRQAVMECIDGLCNEMHTRYEPAFPAGFNPWHYPDHPDKTNVLLSLYNVRLWVSSVRSSEEKQPARGHRRPSQSTFL